MIPASDHTGTPRHFHSSTTSGSAAWISARTRASVSPRQSPSSRILPSISRDGGSPDVVALVFMGSAAPSLVGASCGGAPAPVDIRLRSASADRSAPLGSAPHMGVLHLLGTAGDGGAEAYFVALAQALQRGGVTQAA